MLDCIIIGSGPAAISAALTLQSNGKTFQIFGRKGLSEKIFRAELVHNYPGLTDVKGEDFTKALQAQLSAANIEIAEQTVGGVYAMKDKFIVMAGENTCESKTVILATGVENGKPIQGEEEFLGRGVSYCATCDGFLYKGKTLAVVCTSKQLEHEIEFLAELAEKAYIVPLYKGADIKAKNIEIIIKRPQKIEGKLRVNSFTVGDRTLAVDAVFILKETVAPSALVGGLETKDGLVVVDRACKTNLKGLFAAGDCTGKPYQYAKAVGEGNVAAHSVVEYLASVE